GRGTDCDLRLPVSDVSRHHCIIRLGIGEAAVVDLGSSNGTYLNGQRVRSQAALKSGDELKVGPCRFLVDLGDGTYRGPSGGAGAGRGAPTIKVRDRPAPATGKEEGHPRGGAGGRGGSGG